MPLNLEDFAQRIRRHVLGFLRYKSTNAYDRIVLLSNVYDDSYKALRGEEIPSCLSAPKRRDLHNCLALATCAELLIISSPPRASKRRSARWLKSIVTRFGRVSQIFSANYDARFVRIPLSWYFYVLKVARTVKRRDVIIIDNYEFIYVLAALTAWVLYRVPIILEYEDGKHLTDRGLHRALSGVAEILAKPFLSGAILAQPCLSQRLPPDLPTVVVPGFVVPLGTPLSLPERPVRDLVRFVYSGTLDKPRGVELLIQAARLLPPQGWTLDITGDGPLAGYISQMASSRDLAGKICYHGLLSQPEHDQLLQSCDVGLNLQMSSDPISAVTFPSKLFTYLSHGLHVVSSGASGASSILQGCCFFYAEDTASSVAGAMIQSMEGARLPRCSKMREQIEHFGIEKTGGRVDLFFRRAGVAFS